MKRLRKISILCLLTIMLLSVFAAFAACNEKSEINSSYIDSYEWSYEQEFVDEHDADMVIDGNLSEERWENKKWLEMEQDGVKLKFTTVMTEYGLYVGGIADDPDLVWNARLNIFAWTANLTNSAFSFYIHGKDIDRAGAFEAFSFFFDAYNKRSREQTRFAAKATTYDAEGNVVDIVKDDPVRMVGELFVSWDALNIELVDGELPEYVYVTPYYRHVPADDSSGNERIYPLYSSTLNRFETHPRFSVDGYMTAIDASSPIGRAGNGYSYTSGWNLDRLDKGVVTTTGPHEQVLFYSPLYSNKYVFSVDVKYIQGYPGLNSSCHAGICNMTTYKDLSAMYLYGSRLSGGIAQLQQLYTYGGWKDNTLISIPISNYDANNPEKDKVNIKVIKDGSSFYYIINEVLAYVHTDYELEGKACPGVYTLSAIAEFSNFNGVDYASDEEGLQAEISKYAYKINYDTQINGGEISVNKPAISKDLTDKSLEITVTPTKGFVISEFMINGEDKFNYLLNNMVDGVLRLESVSEDITIVAKFERYTRTFKEDCFNISGKVTDENGKVIASASVAVYNESNPFIRYNVNVTSQGYYSFDLLKPKNVPYQIGDKSYEIGDNYIFEIIPPITYKQTTFTFDCTTLEADQKTITKDVQLQSSLLGENRGILITSEVSENESTKVGLSGTLGMVATTTKDALGVLVTSGNKSVGYYLSWRGFGYHPLDGVADNLYFNNGKLNQNAGPGENVYRKYDWKAAWIDNTSNTSIRVFAMIENDVLTVYYNDKTDIKGDVGEDKWILTWQIDLTDAKFGFTAGSTYKIGIYSNSKNNTSFFLDRVYDETTPSELLDCALDQHVFDYENGVEYPLATCTKSGKITYTCIHCGAKQVVENEPKGHTWGETECSVCHTQKITVTFKNGDEVVGTAYLGEGEKINFPTSWIAVTLKLDGWKLNNEGEVIDVAYCGTTDVTYYAVLSENKYGVTFDSGLTVTVDGETIASGDEVFFAKDLIITFDYGYDTKVVIKDGDTVIATAVGAGKLKYPVTGDVNLTVEQTDFMMKYNGTADGSAPASGTLSQNEEGYMQMPTGIKWGNSSVYNNSSSKVTEADILLELKASELAQANTVQFCIILGTVSGNPLVRLGVGNVKQTETGYTVTMYLYMNNSTVSYSTTITGEDIILRFRVSDVDKTIKMYVNGEYAESTSQTLSTKYAAISLASVKSFGLWFDTRIAWGSTDGEYYSFRYTYVLSDYVAE